VALRVEAERLIEAYVAPQSNRVSILNDLIMLFDGAQQREAQKLADESRKGTDGLDPSLPFAVCSKY
jgi:hypothetical protein